MNTGLEKIGQGGGYDVSDIATGFAAGGGGVVEAFAANNAWHVRVTETVEPQFSGTFQVYAECLKLVPA